jgi:hypothetical protein
MGRGMVRRPIPVLALLVPLPCEAQAPARSAAGGPVAPWTKVPTLVVVGDSANDPRLPLVRDAAAFWNRSFAELGTYFGRFKKTGRSFFGNPRSWAAPPSGHPRRSSARKLFP